MMHTREYNHDSFPARLEVSDDVAETARVMRKVTRHTIPWLFGLGIACYLDRTNLAFAAVQLSRDLELSCTVYGLGAALFFIGYSFQIPSTIACRRFGAPLWLSIIVGVWGLVAMAFAATTGKVMFLVLRVALGLAECGTFPGIWHHLSQFYTPQELGSAYATVVTSTALAQVVGAPMAAAILSLDGVGGLRGWQWLFISEGALTIAFAALLKANLAKSPSEATYLTPSERAWLQRRQDMQPSAGGAENVTLQFNAAARVLRNWRCWYLAAMWLTITTSMYGTIFFAPLIIRSMFDYGEKHVAESSYNGNSTTPHSQPALSSGCGGGEDASHGSGAGVALLSMVPFAAAAVAMVVNARWAERANERHKHAGIPISMAAVAMALTPAMLKFVGPAAAFLSLVMAAACIWAFHGPFMSWPAVFLRGEEASLGFSMINSFGSLGGFVGPLLLGVLADKGEGYGAAMLVLAGLLAVGAIGILNFKEPRAAPVPMEFDEEPAEKGMSVVEREPMLNTISSSVRVGR